MFTNAKIWCAYSIPLSYILYVLDMIVSFDYFINYYIFINSESQITSEKLYYSHRFL